MATEKQIKANQANSKKSTGAKTPEGKAVVADNALKHGLFSSRLILAGESLEEYHQLLDDLITSLMPHGAYEHMLVEKVAVAVWRQLRLTRAESAAIELDRRADRAAIWESVKQAMGMKWTDGDLSKADALPLSDTEKDTIQWCKVVLAEYEKLDIHKVMDGELAELKNAPHILEQFQEERESEAYGSDEDYKKALEYGLHEWVIELREWCKKQIRDAERRPIIKGVLELVQAKESAPISNELMLRYQVALDAELYRAAEALRKQQEHRHKVGITIEAEA